jgi:lambda family phage minor tail protein L
MDLTALDQDAPIELIEISEWNLADETETIYLCAIPGVSFDGQSYDPIAMSTRGFDLIGQGTPPAPEVMVSNFGQIVAAWLYQCKQEGYRLEGCKVKRRVTQKRYLDGQPSAGASQKEDPFHVFFLEQVSENKRECGFGLVDPFNRQGETLPSRYCGRGCPWEYRKEECGYTGSAMFDIFGNPTLDKKKDRCAKTVEACTVRHPNADLPHGGFPGLQTF